MPWDQCKRPATPATPTTPTTGRSVQWKIFTTIKGHSGASPSRDIPVLPLISHPLKKKSSDLLSILTTDICMPCPPPKIVAYTAFNDLPEMTPVRSVYDSIPYTSVYRMQVKKAPGASTSTNITDHTSNKNYGSSASKDIYDDLPYSSERNFGPSSSKDIYNEFPQSSTWTSGSTSSKGTYYERVQSSVRFSDASFPKSTYNQLLQTSKRNSVSSGSKHSSIRAMLLADAGSSIDEFAELKKVITNSPGYPWYDVPLISHESLQVTKNTSSSEVFQDAAEVLVVPEYVKPPLSPKRHPSTVSHLYHYWGKKRYLSNPTRTLPPVKLYQLHKNTAVDQEPKVGQQGEKAPKASRFKMMYFRGDLPIRAHSTARGNVLRWTSNIDDLDYNLYLPVFFEGLRYKEEPWCFFARQGCMDLLNKHSSRVFDTVGELVKPIKDALETRNKAVMCHTLRVVQKLLSCAPNVGKALIPHLHSILPILSRFLNDKFTYEEKRFGFRTTKTLGEAINGTLRAMEENGGRDAYLYIKLLVPSYESCGLNKMSR